MKPCSSEMQGINSIMNPSPSPSSSSQIPFQDIHNQQIQNPHFDPSSNDDFLEQMLSTIPSCSWADLKSSWELNPTSNLTIPLTNSTPKLRNLSDEPSPSIQEHNNIWFRNFDESLILASKLRQNQINGGGGPSASAASKLLLQQQLILGAAGGGLSPDVVDASSFKSPAQGGEYNGFGGGYMQGNLSQQHFNQHQPQNFGASAAVMNQTQPSGGTPAQPRQRVRARRGQATDPHSIAERLRRERIAERMKALQELVPNANKTDKASLLDEIIDYVKFLQLQVKVLSMSRLGGAADAAPLVADISSEVGGICIQANANNGGTIPRTSNANQTSPSNDSLTVTEQQVAKLMEDDMGSAMQYLQGKGLCLMPISLATAISAATCHSRNNNPVIPTTNHHNLHHALLKSNGGGDGPSSPSMSVLTVQSASMRNGETDASVKDAASVSKT